MVLERLNRQYDRDSFVDRRIEVRPSKIHGSGIFTKEKIKEGEIVIVWGGVVFTADEVASNGVRPNSPVEIGEGLFLAEPINGTDCEDEYMNHSCCPNLWMVDEVTLAAKRDIGEGEELTIDYAMFFSNSPLAHLYGFKCKCGSSICRSIVTRHDWKLEELQQRYKNHFSPYLNERIRNASLSTST